MNYLRLVTNICIIGIWTTVVPSIAGLPASFFSKYLTIQITQPLVHDLIQTKAFRRLALIKQYGVDGYCIPDKASDYNRQEHSLRVYELLRRFGASLEEQIAGLLHDTSHTVFSHVGDFIFSDGESDDAYQDTHHVAILSRTDIKSVMSAYGYCLDILDHKSGNYPMLEQPLPRLCADRIEYNITAGILEHMITPAQAADLVEDLAWDSRLQHWYFRSPDSARTLGMISLYHTEHVWGSVESQYYSYYVAQAIRHGLQIGLLTYNDILYGTDDNVWDTLMRTTDPIIATIFTSMWNTSPTSDPVSRTLYRKFRGVDPLVLQPDGSLRPLTEVDPEYCAEFQRVKQALHSSGW